MKMLGMTPEMMKQMMGEMTPETMERMQLLMRTPISSTLHVTHLRPGGEIGPE
jgi:hypothetical protein